MTPALRLVVTVIAFAILVPAFGVAVVSGIAAMIFDNEPGSMLRLDDIVAVLGEVGFAFGVVPAAGVGVAVGLCERRPGGAGWRYVLLAGLAGGVVFVVALAIVTFDPQSGFVPGYAAELLLAAIGTLLVWRITRLLPRPSRPA